ncbi:LysM peptidoglycan-binding domain-containing protein [bacterium]|nr:LysM peptidoglycan-binding domain-containing protein [bacterium]
MKQKKQSQSNIFLNFCLERIEKVLYFVLFFLVKIKRTILKFSKQYYIYLLTGAFLIVAFIGGLLGQKHNPDLLFQFNKKQLIVEKTGDYSEKPDFTISAYLEKERPTVSLEGSALVTPDLNVTDDYLIQRTKIISYKVQPGDNIEKIAKKFGISVNSVLWENKLTKYSIIRPGQILRILPVTGISHKVKYGETLEKIAKKYKASIEDIVDYNNLADASSIRIGDVLIIPNGVMPQIIPRRRVARLSRSKDKVLLVSKKYTSYRQWVRKTKCHTYRWGQCTSWVAFKWSLAKGKCLPGNWGHAKYWLYRARRAGYATGKTPKVGAIVSLRERGWRARLYGHVAYVEEVGSDTITISEMNFKGAWIVDKRTLKKNDYRIIGYIY